MHELSLLKDIFSKIELISNFIIFAEIKPGIAHGPVDHPIPVNGFKLAQWKPRDISLDLIPELQEFIPIFNCFFVLFLYEFYLCQAVVYINAPIESLKGL